MKMFIQVILVLLGMGALSVGLLRWLGSTPEPAAGVPTLTQQALLLAESRGCVACHSLDGSPGIGPSWLGSWGTQRRFVDGSMTVVDAAYLRESMLAPAARVVEGFDNVMLPTMFTAAEVELLTTFIRDLQPR
jgi:cytochrome c oxidase subunit II